MQVIDFSQYGNCQIYEFRTSFKINSIFHIEQQQRKIKLSKLVHSMWNAPSRLLHPTAVQLLHTSLRNTEFKDLISGLFLILTNNDRLEILYILIRTGHLNEFLWADLFQIELNILSTVFKTIIIVSIDMEVLSMEFEDIPQNDSFFIYWRNRKFLGNLEYLSTLGEAENRRTVNMESLICGVRKSLENIKLGKIAFFASRQQKSFLNHNTTKRMFCRGFSCIYV